MAFNIQTSNNQQFSELTSEPQYQDWAFTPKEFTNDVISFIGGAQPDDRLVQTQIKNYVALFEGVYDEITIYRDSTYNGNSQYFSVQGPLNVSNAPGYVLTQDNLQVDTRFIFDNLETLSDAIIFFGIRFVVYGRPTGGRFDFIERMTYNFRARRISSDSVYTENTSFHHLIGDPLPPAKIERVYANGAFTLSVGKHIALSGGNLQFQSTQEDGSKTYTGTDTQDVSIALLATIEDLGETTYLAPFIVSNTKNTVQRQVTVNQVAAHFLTVVPNQFEFFAVKGIQEAQAKVLRVETFGNWDIAHPSWLEVDPVSGEHSSGVINVKPVPSLNLASGVYEGVIFVNAREKQREIPVMHKVVDEINLNLSETQVNFTRDRESITNFYKPNLGLFSALTNARVTLNLFTKAYNYRFASPSEFNNYFVKDFFNNFTNFFFGPLVEQLMPQLKDLSEIGAKNFNSIIADKILYYNPSENELETAYINEQDIEISGYNKTFNFQFIKGRRPQRLQKSYGIINVLESELRVTTKSKAVVNILNKEDEIIIRRYINGNLVGQVSSYTQSNQLVGHLLRFNDCQPGDFVEIRLEFIDGEAPDLIQRYLVIPEGKQSYHIAWEDEHGLLQLLEFTGDYTIESDHQEIAVDSFIDFLSKRERLDTAKDIELTADTGFIFQANQEYIDSLLSRKRAWVIFDDKDPIALVPKEKKITNLDSDQELYSYAIQFKINAAHEFESITF